MKITNKITGLKRFVLAGAMLASTLAGTANSADLGTRLEQTTGSTEDTKTTLCLSDNKFGSIKDYAHFGDSGDYTSLAIQSKLGITGIVNAGDKEGYGVEVSRKLGDFTLTGNADTLRGQNGKERIGAGLDYNLGPLTLGAGLDNVEQGNQVLGRAYLTGKENQVGTGLRKLGDENSASGFWCHYGPKEEFGTRTYAMNTWNDKNSDSKLVFDTIFAQNPTLGEASSPWITGRNTGDMFDTITIENPLSPERVPLNNRSKQGIVLEACFVDSRKDCTENRSLRTDLGYTFPQISSLGNAKPGVIAFYNFNFDNKDKEYAGASATLGVGGLFLEATGKRLADGSVDAYVSASFACPIGSSK
jgi:hypothetical protein